MINRWMEAEQGWPWNERAIAALYGLWSLLLTREAAAKRRK